MISIVVPIQGSDESMLSQFIDMCLSQTYRDWELLLIPEGSDSHLSSELKKKIKKDNRIFILSRSGSEPDKKTEQAGSVCFISAARNTGLDKASGKYVVFPEMDDVMEPQYLMTLHDAIRNDGAGSRLIKGFRRLKVQMAMTGYFVDQINADGERELIDETAESVSRVIDAEDMLCRIFYMWNYQGCIYNKIFRRDIIDKYFIRFDEQIWSNEDQLFLTEYLTHCKAVRFNTDHVYHSVMRDVDYSEFSEETDTALSAQLPDDVIRESTELTAYHKMRHILKKHLDPKWFCEQDFVFYAADIYGRLEETASEYPEGYQAALADNEKYFKQLRKMFKRASRIEYYPSDDWEEGTLQRMEHYARTGEITGEATGES